MTKLNKLLMGIIAFIFVSCQVDNVDEQVDNIDSIEKGCTITTPCGSFKYEESSISVSAVTEGGITKITISNSEGIVIDTKECNKQGEIKTVCSNSSDDNDTDNEDSGTDDSGDNDADDNDSDTDDSEDNDADDNDSDTDDSDDNDTDDENSDDEDVNGCTLTTECGTFTYNETSINVSAVTNNGITNITVTNINGEVIETLNCDKGNSVSTVCNSN